MFPPVYISCKYVCSLVTSVGTCRQFISTVSTMQYGGQCCGCYLFTSAYLRACNILASVGVAPSKLPIQLYSYVQLDVVVTTSLYPL